METIEKTEEELLKEEELLNEKEKELIKENETLIKEEQSLGKGNEPLKNSEETKKPKKKINVLRQHKGLTEKQIERNRNANKKRSINASKKKLEELNKKLNNNEYNMINNNNKYIWISAIIVIILFSSYFISTQKGLSVKNIIPKLTQQKNTAEQNSNQSLEQKQNISLENITYTF